MNDYKNKYIIYKIEENKHNWVIKKRNVKEESG